MIPLSDAEGLELFDVARTMDAPALVPMSVDFAALRSQARARVLPEVLGGLVRAPARGGARGGSLARRLAAAAESDWDAIALELVRTHAAAVLGQAAAESIDAGRPFKELGFDSLAAWS